MHDVTMRDYYMPDWKNSLCRDGIITKEDILITFNLEKFWHAVSFSSPLLFKTSLSDIPDKSDEIFSWWQEFCTTKFIHRIIVLFSEAKKAAIYHSWLCRINWWLNLVEYLFSKIFLTQTIFQKDVVISAAVDTEINQDTL